LRLEPLKLFNMIRYILPLWVIIIYCACGESNFNADLAAHKKEVYRQAMQNSDTDIAIQALYDIIAVQPSQQHWQDSIALLYVQQKAYRQAIRVSDKKLQTMPDDTLMLKVQAISYKALGNSKNALEAYEKLYPLTKNIYHLYEIATTQYGMTRLQECLQTAQSIHRHPELGAAKVNLNFNKQQQVVPLKAATYNIQGVVAKDLDKKSEAKTFFEQALQVFPDFALAKGNLEEVN